MIGIIDDEEIFGEILSDVISEHYPDLEIFFATSIADFEQKYQNVKIKLLLVDIT